MRRVRADRACGAAVGHYTSHESTTLGPDEISDVQFIEDLIVESGDAICPYLPLANPAAETVRRPSKRLGEFYPEPEPESRRLRRSMKVTERHNTSWLEALAFAGVPVCAVCRATNANGATWCTSCGVSLATPAPKRKVPCHLASPEVPDVELDAPTAKTSGPTRFMLTLATLLLAAWATAHHFAF